jgi:integrase
MPLRAEPLFDKQIREAKTKPDQSVTCLFDGGGLYVEIHKTGVKRWRLKYRHEGKAHVISLGRFPEVSLKEARQMRDRLREILRKGGDPAAEQQAARSAQRKQNDSQEEPCLLKVAEKWRERWKTHVSEQTEKEIWANLEHNVFPEMGLLPISRVATKTALDCLRKIEATGRGATLRKAKGALSLIFKFAAQEGLVTQNPMTNFDRHTFKKFAVHNFPAITDPMEVGKLLRAIDAYQGTLPSVGAALRLAPLLFQRIGELRTMRWQDVDLESAEWFFTVGKTQTPHHVPLSHQAVAILREIHPLTGDDDYVFPSFRSGRPISEAAINTALEAMGYDTRTQMTGHGFRAMAYTLLREKLKFPKEIVDFQLAHRHSEDRYNGAYARMTFADERQEMMQAWADYLDRLKAGAAVILLRARG